MTIKNIYILVLAFLSSTAHYSQTSETWENYVQAKKKGKEPILPDFSYAGYKYSEEQIPNVNFKIFDVTEYGAIPSDSKSDKNAIKKAIAAAIKNKEGIIFFPKGTYHVNTDKDDSSPIIINSSNIVFRGEGEGENGSILHFMNDLPPADPKKLYSCPAAIQTSAGGSDKFLTNVTSNATRETFEIKVQDASKLKKGDWVILKLINNDKKLVQEDISPLELEDDWKKIINTGVQVNERHQIASIKGKTVVFCEPIHYNVRKKHGWKLYSFAHSEGLGFENLRFEGNWKKEFVHHRSAEDDSGWGILKVSRAVNSWVRNCTFKNVTNPLGFSQAAYSTAIDITIEGNIGHSSVHAGGGSTGILIANVNDLVGMHHAVGVGGGSTSATVIWRSKYPSHTSFESHASQPRCTLFDNIEGGFFTGRAGGARQSLPNHSKYLVLWNYKQTSAAIKDFRFVATDSWYWRIVPPIIVGFHGAETTFKNDEVQIAESIGTPVQPESLFEEQLKLRLGELPNWILTYK
ncbi:DUF4955 domain-containing protein [Flavicella marina]|uniref:DUF4955 domain-containing protein n=1 Tax=Flavicella marina TaxID=1475951 RepID=UPI001264638E|nr:DUF4955 domain-containing protein [Flavicella marina]